MPSTTIFSNWRQLLIRDGHFRSAVVPSSFLFSTSSQIREKINVPSHFRPGWPNFLPCRHANEFSPRGRHWLPAKRCSRDVSSEKCARPEWKAYACALPWLGRAENQLGIRWAVWPEVNAAGRKEGGPRQRTSTRRGVFKRNRALC